MGKTTGIEWCDHTFNPIWGCTKVSPGCAHCYAEGIANRFKKGAWGPKGKRVVSKRIWADPAKWNKAAYEAGVRKKVFCASMSDVFEANPVWDDVLPDLWAIIESTAMLDWLLLTKRPENVLVRVPSNWLYYWPSNVWLGTSVENQEWAQKRIDLLQHIPAKTRFLSCEPLLGPIDLTPWLDQKKYMPSHLPMARPIDWVIVGGESGEHCRPMDIEWARKIKDDCAAAGVPFFMKQLGGHRNKRGQLSDFPEDLRIREFPNDTVYTLF